MRQLGLAVLLVVSAVSAACRSGGEHAHVPDDASADDGSTSDGGGTDEKSGDGSGATDGSEAGISDASDGG
jgi:hypothetical protein